MPFCQWTAHIKLPTYFPPNITFVLTKSIKIFAKKWPQNLSESSIFLLKINLVIKTTTSKHNKKAIGHTLDTWNHSTSIDFGFILCYKICNFFCGICKYKSYLFNIHVNWVRLEYFFLTFETAEWAEIFLQNWFSTV